MTAVTSDSREHDSREHSRLVRVAHDRAGFWIATGLEIAGLILFVGLFNFLFPTLGDNLDGAPLIGLGLLFALVPAALWLGFFYRMDRLEAEPKRMVFNTFLLGVLVAAALRGPILQGVFQTQDWLYTTWWAHLLGGVLVVGVVDQLLVYATVRYAIFNHPEFDERVDGVIYALAVGLGIATVLNFQYVWARGGVDLGIGSIRMVINALAYASFAGVVGYALGQSRFERVSAFYLPAAISLAALFNGLFFYALDRTVAQALTYNPWGDLLFAGIVAAITAALLFWLIARANEETLRLSNRESTLHLEPEPPDSPGREDPMRGGFAPLPADTEPDAEPGAHASSQTHSSQSHGAQSHSAQDRSAQGGDA